MPSSPATFDAEVLRPIADDLDLERLLPLGTPGRSSRFHAVAAGSAPAPETGRCVEALEEGLGERDTLLVVVEGRPADSELAAWRNALWPLLHVGRVYRSDGAAIRCQTLQGTAAVAGALPACAVLVAARRTRVLSPEATVEKFDSNAPGWNGAPGGAGYPHFRWMRRFVADFAGDSRPRRILDFGCGAGWVGIEAALRAPGAELCAFDPSPEMVRIATENAREAGVARFAGRTGFGEEPPFPRDGEPPFDLVLSSGVLSFAPDLERWLDGLASTVAPGGTLVVGDVHRGSRGMRARRAARPLLPVRELNARSPEEVRPALERRGFVARATAGYQLTWPIPEAMHLSETRLGGLLARPLLLLNRGGAALDRLLGHAAASQFDSWVMRLQRSIPDASSRV